jgi:hypothetical protein
MDAQMLEARFARIGARLQVSELTSGERGRNERLLTLDVQSDAGGEFFDIRLRKPADLGLEVVDLRRRQRHLLLQAHEGASRHYYLCGHDEQHWFVAAVPGRGETLTNVFRAMEALKPPEVLEAQRRQGIKGKDLQRRKNAAYIRQGEWFFLPAPKLHVQRKFVLYNEPLSRGEGSKPHWAEMLYRKGGEEVYVSDAYPQGLRSDAYRSLIKDRPRTKSWHWRQMFRNPEAYVKGKIRHPDHKTIELHIWHKVVMNTEGQSEAMRHVVFLD